MRPWTRASRVLLAAGVLAGGLASTLVGCQALGAAAYYLGPRRIQKAEFKLAQGPLAIVLEMAHPEQDQPLFTRSLHERLVRVFRERNVNDRVVSLERTLELAREPGFRSWSLQRIGRELEAEQVLYLRVESLTLREESGHPVLTPSVALRAKVISVADAPPHERLWPKEREGREMSCSRPSQEATDANVIDHEAGKLGRDTAELVARWFYDFDQEEPAPRER